MGIYRHIANTGTGIGSSPPTAGRLSTRWLPTEESTSDGCPCHHIPVRFPLACRPGTGGSIPYGSRRARLVAITSPCPVAERTSSITTAGSVLLDTLVYIAVPGSGIRRHRRWRKSCRHDRSSGVALAHANNLWSESLAHSRPTALHDLASFNGSSQAIDDRCLSLPSGQLRAGLSVPGRCHHIPRRAAAPTTVAPAPCRCRVPEY